MGLFYPFAAFYAKTNGFASSAPTFSAIAYVEQENPAEAAAIAWVRENVAPDALLVEGKGLSYRANYARMSAATGRPTLLGWDGHENQWRGKRFGEMAGGRAEALEKLYRNGSVDEITQLVVQWQMDYVYVGPAEREQYAMTPLADERLAAALDLVFSEGNVRIYQRRNK